MTTPPRQSRRFGLEIGIATAIAGALLLRAHHRTFGTAFVVLGVALVACAIARPSLLDPISRRWLAFAATLARITTPIVLAVLYFIVVTPMAFLRRTLGRSPLERDPDADTYWIASMTRTNEEGRSRMERPF